MAEPIPKGMKPASEHFVSIASFKDDHKRHKRLICAALLHISSSFSSRGCIVSTNPDQVLLLKKKAGEMLSKDMFDKLGFTTYEKYKESNREGEISDFKYFIDPPCFEKEIVALLNKWEQFDEPEYSLNR